MAIVFGAVAWAVYALYRSCWSDTYFQSNLNNEYREKMMKSLSSAFIATIETNVSYLMELIFTNLAGKG